MSDSEEVQSPCVSICALNDDDVCMGCYRSAQEITDWWDSSNIEKRQILTHADERAKKANTFF